MTEHVCEWRVWEENMEWGISCVICFNILGDEELESRLNATERLSAEDAKEAAKKLGYVYKESRDILRAYADMLEGK